MIKAAVTAALTAKGGPGLSSTRLDERFYRRVGQFSAQSWKEFVSQLRTATGFANARIRDAPDEILKGEKDFKWDDIFRDWGDQEIGWGGGDGQGRDGLERRACSAGAMGTHGAASTNGSTPGLRRRPGWP